MAAKKPRKLGNGSKLFKPNKEAAQEIILKNIKHGTRKAVCELAGINHTTLSNWITEGKSGYDEEFSIKFLAAEAKDKMELMSYYWKEAKNGNVRAMDSLSIMRFNWKVKQVDVTSDGNSVVLPVVKHKKKEK